MSVPAIIIGGGINELVAGHYLARAGHRVLVVTERSSVGNAPFDAAWISPGIVRDLVLDRHGLSVRHEDPWAVAALADGARLELSHDIARSADEIRKQSPHDAANWPEFCARMHALARVLESLYVEPPPDPLANELIDLGQLARVALRVRGLGRRGIEDLLRLLPMSVADLLDEWFESDALKGVLGAAGIRHLYQGPRSGGTAFNFLHHHVGSPAGVFRQPLTNVARALTGLPGVESRHAKVAQIKVQQGRVAGVVLSSGEEIDASLVVSGVHPRRTLLELLDPAWLDPQLVRAVQRIRSRGVVAELAFVLSRDPGFTTLVIAPSLDYLERAYDEAKYGRISREPYLEARYAGVADNGEHQLHVHFQYVPHARRDGDWDDDRRSAVAKLAVECVSRQVAGFAGSVIGQTVRSPLELESTYGYPEGQAYHAELGLDQILWMRPVPDLAQYRTPIRGLYLCGLAMHPGGGIAGAAGANAGRTILRDLRKQKRKR
jgi:phytoene dehydrogenase-like protein